MRILLLTQYFPPEVGAAAARCSEHAALWAQAGHDVVVCTGLPNYPTGVVPQAYRGKLFRREKADGCTIIRSWLYVTPTRGLMNRVLSSFSFMVSAFLAGLFKCRRPDVIVASSGPFFVGPLGYLLSLSKRAPFVFEVRDILPQQAMDVGMIRNRTLIRVLTAIEEFLYRRAAAIVTVAPASRDAIVNRGVSAAKCFTVENGVREELFVPGDRDNPVRAEYGWNDKFIVMYIGTHGVSQGLVTLLEAAQRSQDHPGIRFVFVGEGADKPKLIERANQMALKNVDFIPSQSKDRMPAFYAAADVCVVPLKNAPYFRINIPSKLFEIMACERPVIIGAEGEAARIVADARAGLPAAPEDPDSYVRAILELYNDPDRAQTFGRQGRAYVLAHFTRRRKAVRYLEVLQSIIGLEN